MNTLINFIFTFILFISLFNLVSLSIVLLNKILYKSTDFFYYKITNIFFTYCIVFLYVGYFIIFLYALRIYNWNHQVDLKVLWIQFQDIFHYVSTEINIYSGMLINIGILLLLILYMLILMYITKIALHHMLMLTLKYIYPQVRKYSTTFGRFLNHFYLIYCPWLYIGHHDPFTSFIIYFLRRFGRYINKEYEQNGDPDIFPFYHPIYIIHWLAFTHREKYKLFIRLSPLLFVIYDCIFNDFVISKVFIYLIAYIPIMLFHQIYTKFSIPAIFINNLFLEIYYKKFPYLYAIAETDLNLLKLYLLSGFDGQRLTDNIFDPITLPELYLKEVMVFDVYDSTDQVYYNDMGNHIQKLPDKDNELIEIPINYDYIPEEGEDIPEEPAYVKVGRKWTLIQDNTSGIIRNKPIPGEVMERYRLLQENTK